MTAKAPVQTKKRQATKTATAGPATESRKQTGGLLAKLRAERSLVLSGNPYVPLRACSRDCGIPDDVWPEENSAFWPADPRTKSTGGFDVFSRYAKALISALHRHELAASAAGDANAWIRPHAAKPKTAKARSADGQARAAGFNPGNRETARLLADNGPV